MRYLHKKYIVIILLLIISIMLSIGIERSGRRETTAIDFSVLPRTLGNWQGNDLKISDDVFEMLGTDDVIMRKYIDPEGDSVLLAIVYSSETRDAVHPPEICYLGDGVELMRKGREKIRPRAGIELGVNTLSMKSISGTTTAWYWFLAGDRFIGDYYLQQLCYLRDSLQGRPLRTALVRVSVPGDSPVLCRKGEEFIVKIYPFLEKLFFPYN